MIDFAAATAQKFLMIMSSLMQLEAIDISRRYEGVERSGRIGGVSPELQVEQDRVVVEIHCLQFVQFCWSNLVFPFFQPVSPKYIHPDHTEFGAFGSTHAFGHNGCKQLRKI